VFYVVSEVKVNSKYQVVIPKEFDLLGVSISIFDHSIP